MFDESNAIKPQFVEPRLLKGMQDLLPEAAIARDEAIRVIESVFQRYGFVPVETPALEYLDVLLGAGGEETNKELFRLESPEQEQIALRFDLTVPFSRVVAQYPAVIKPPFRRYAIGPVWRADKPGPGRFRQFVQVDIDIAGAQSMAADAEIVAVMSGIMQSLGVTDYTVVINNRKVIDALLTGIGITEPQRQKHVLRVIDKLQKVGIDNVRRELGTGRIDESGDPIPGVQLAPDVAERICAFVGIKGATRVEVLNNVRTALGSSPVADEAIAELSVLSDCLSALGVTETQAVFEPSLARGLDYYTGPVFETVIGSAPQFGSVMGGGRYDGLVSRFMERAIPCTGMSVGLDRLLAALTHLELLRPRKTLVEVLVVTMGKVPPQETLRLAAELRDAGFRTETYLGAKQSMKVQFSHADHYGIPVAVILGEDELANGKISIKDLMAGKTQREGIADHESYRQAGKTAQVTLSRSEMVAHVRSLLG